jgi:hypothetical protein
VLYLHGLNPHGFSFKRRVTHENVDLNRNFQDFSKPLPVNSGYAEVHDLALPKDWPEGLLNKAALALFVAKRGMSALQAAISGGQYTHADGLFFGGQAPTWSNQMVRQVLREWVGGAGGKHPLRERMGWIDIHTGLGPSGHGERIHGCPEDTPEPLQRARAWWGGNGQTPITSFNDGTSTSAKLTGLMNYSVRDECANTECTGIALEFGTVPMMDVINALRGDHWAHRERMQGRSVAAELQAQITQATWDAFYTQTDLWKGQIVSQTRQCLFQAADGLAGV